MIRYPLTRFVVDAKTAIAPSIVLTVAFASPARMMAPTTAMDEIALVSDISGVCSSRDTFWMTSNPRNVDSMKTKSMDHRSRFCTGRV